VVWWLLVMLLVGMGFYLFWASTTWWTAIATLLALSAFLYKI